MPDEADFGAVVADVQLLAQTALDPSLTLAEVQAVVRETARASTWAANTAYTFGQYVYPTAANRNGRRYRVIIAGTSHATTEPTWSEIDGDEFEDGTVTFREAGVLYGSVYDKRKAVHKCLAIRYAKDQLVDASADGRTLHLSQRAQRIERLMRSYQPVELA